MSGSITVSCGHKINCADDGIPVMFRGRSRKGMREIIHATFCGECSAEWSAMGLLFQDQNEANAWLAKMLSVRANALAALEDKG